MVDHKSFSGHNKVIMYFKAREIIPIALPDMVDSFIIKMITRIDSLIIINFVV